MKTESDEEKEKLIRIEIGKRIKKLIHNSGLNQAEVSKSLGVTPQSVQQWCIGRTSPKITQIKALADLLGSTASFIIDGSDLPIINKNVVSEPAELISYFARLTMDQQKIKFSEIKDQVFENMKIFNEMNYQNNTHTA